jgi:hypothetical protein
MWTPAAYKMLQAFASQPCLSLSAGADTYLPLPRLRSGLTPPFATHSGYMYCKLVLVLVLVMLGLVSVAVELLQ